MKIDFYYWSNQCPINNETILLLNEFKSDFEINYYDILHSTKMAMDKRIYFPFLTIFNDTIRWRGPLNRGIIESVLRGEEIVEMPYIIKFGEEKFLGEILELNDSTVHLVSSGCTMNNCLDSCVKKKEFLINQGDDFYGYLHLDKGKVVGGVEYLPSMQVPYNIPKDKETAFLTCLYRSSTEYDYKAYPLQALEKRLVGKYRNIIAVTDELGTFPNGNLEWFLKQGYLDEGVVSVEADYCTLHLVRKIL